MRIVDELKNPGMKYRPVPFWSWNDKLDPQELRHQINLMHDAGLGGYFMHARGGLLTQYMSDDWFDCTRTCIEEGRKFGMNTWAYDENGWPSGFGNGMVNGLGLKYHQKYLRLETVDSSNIKRGDSTIGYFDPNGLTSLDHPEKHEGERLLHFYYDVNPYYVDTLDREVIGAFLEKVHQEYYQRLTPKEWSGLSGFFTDEPQVSRKGIPWSFIMEREYEKNYGEQLLPLLPQLFMEVGGFRRTRYRFWRLVTILFMNHFMKQIYDWCDAHHCRVTGHHVMEETYNSQLTCNGAVMPHYQYYHIPGMDWLNRHIKPVTTPVQVASVCAQTGRKQVLAETFALCGWNVRMEELKWIAQWQMVHGINLICQHLESYTLKGIRKRDYPASLFYHLPWWDEYRRFNDYISRLGVLLSEGEIHTDVMILHGQSTAWLCFSGSNDKNEVNNRYFDSLNQLSEQLDTAHINYHYGDETLIAMHGKVEGNQFVVGRQRYGVVVIPQLKNFSLENFVLLRQFVLAEGQVLAVRNQIEPDEKIYVGGDIDSRMAELSGHFTWFASEAELTAALPRFTAVCPVVKPGTPALEANEHANQLGEIAFTSRYFTNLDGTPATVYYFVNNDLQNVYDSEIYLPGDAVERFDPANGRFSPVRFRRVNGKCCLPHCFAPGGDLVLVSRTGRTRTLTTEVELCRSTPATLSGGKPPVDLNGKYRLTAMSANLLTLDYCSYWFDGKLQENNGYVLNIQDRALKLKRPVDVEMEFRFEVAADYDGRELFLVMEIPERFDAAVNGKPLPYVDAGFQFDPAFRKLDIRPLVKSGENTIRLKTRFSQPDHVYECLERAKVFESEKNKLSYLMEIEAIYLAGDFGVKAAHEFQPLAREAVRVNPGFTLCRRPEQVELGRIHESGLPFFGGKVTLSRDFEVMAGEESGRCLLFDCEKAIVAKFRLNGKDLASLIWHPYSMALDGILKAGTNHLEIELTNSLRNMLGPHHLEEGESYGVGPSSFYKEPGAFFTGWRSSSWNDDYCLVEFGLDNLRII